MSNNKETMKTYYEAVTVKERYEEDRDYLTLEFWENESAFLKGYESYREQYADGTQEDYKNSHFFMEHAFAYCKK